MKLSTLTATLLLTAASLHMTGTPAFAADHKIIKLHQEVPELHQLKVEENASSPWGMLAFEAHMTGEGGLEAELDGILITADLAEGSETTEDRIGEIVIDFGHGTSLVVEGKSIYLPATSEMTTNAPQLRAVVGGTGDYIGARGQVTTQHNTDGSYDHVIELVD